jgi:hypothetical protein
MAQMENPAITEAFSSNLSTAKRKKKGSQVRNMYCRIQTTTNSIGSFEVANMQYGREIIYNIEFDLIPSVKYFLQYALKALYEEGVVQGIAQCLVKVAVTFGGGGKGS